MLPSPDEMHLEEVHDLSATPYGWDVQPFPGGCLVSSGPRYPRRRRSWWG